MGANVEVEDAGLLVSAPIAALKETSVLATPSLAVPILGALPVLGPRAVSGFIP